MAGVPVTFRDQRERQLVNYSFINFASGSGVVKFFLGQTANGNRLSENAFYSNQLFIMSSVSTSGSFVKVLDEDFDTEFLRPVTIDGTGVIDLGMGMKNDETNDDMRIYAIVKIRKWDGSTETDLATFSGSSNPIIWNADTLQTQRFASHSLSGDIPKTSFKIGESLRVTTEIWVMSNGTADIQIALGVDPKNRTKVYPKIKGNNYSEGDEEVDLSTMTGAFTNSSASIPFRVDI